VSAVPDDVVEDRVEERLGLAGSRSRRHQRRLRALSLAEVATAQTFEGSGLVTVGVELSGRDLKRVAAARLGFEGCARADEGAFEDPGVRITEELIECRLHARIGKSEGRAQVLGEGFTSPAGLSGRQKLAHEAAPCLESRLLPSRSARRCSNSA